MAALALHDHLGRAVHLATHPPQRIVSLCPSQTETLFYLGAGPQVVGCTRWCIHPRAAIDAVAKVGGTKKVNMARVHALKPDLILCEKEENTPEIVAALSAHYPVYVTNIESMPDALRGIQDMGALVGRPNEAQRLALEIQTAWQHLPTAPPLRTAYLIWQDPYMAVGHDTYIQDVLLRLGLQNVCLDSASRYPEVTLDALRALDTQLVLLSSEPYSFTATHVTQLKAALPQARVLLVDGEMFSWYGSRMLLAAAYFKTLLPTLVP